MENKNVSLTADEIRTAFAIRDRYIQAQARAVMAAEMEAEYFNQLRQKYSLGENWQCNDLLIGFELKAGTDDENN